MTTQARRMRRLDPRALPIAAKIAIGLAVVLLLSGFITDRLVQQLVRDAQTEAVMSDLQTLSRTLALRMVDEIGQEVTTLNQLGTSPTIRDVLRERRFARVEPPETLLQYATDPELREELAEFRRTNVEFESVTLLDAHGYILAIDPLPPDVADREPQRFDWFDSAYNNGLGALYISGPQEDHLTGISGVHFAVPIHEPGPIGVIYAIWNLSTVAEAVELGGGREGMVVEPDGTVLLAASMRRGDTVPPAVMERVRQSPQGAFTYTDWEGKTWLYGYTTFTSLGLVFQPMANLRWIVMTRTPLEAAQAGAAALAGRLRVALGLSVASVTLLIAVLTIASLRPLQHLTEAAARIQAGELEAPIPILPPDEIGRLADVLREMVAQLLKRLRQLSAAVQVSHATVLTLDINQLLGDVAQAIVKQFGHAAVRVYLAEANAREARLQAIAGQEEGALRLGERLPVDNSTLVGRAMLYNEPQFGEDRARPEVALPLWKGERPLGALHVIGEAGMALGQDDVNVLTLVADQLSSAIENARLFEQSVANLAEIEALNRRLTRQAWEEYLEEGGVLRHTLDPERRWPETPETIRRREDVRAEIYTDAEGRSVLAVPLVLRGETIGTLAVTRPAHERWTQTEVSLLESVASRLVMVAESIRLVEEASRRAEREQQVSEVSAALLQRAASVDSVLQAALSQLSNVLGSDQVSLRIGQPPVADGRHIGPGKPSEEGGDGDAPSEATGE